MKNESRITELVLRRASLAHVLDCIEDAFSCSIVGLSNVGKSRLLRSLCQRDVQAASLGAQADEFVFVYVDCNMMLELSEQGFYVAVLQATRDVLAQASVGEALLAEVESYYQGVVDSSHALHVSLNFNNAIVALNKGLPRRIVFLFDEFDAPFEALDSRVFLNLRALKDRYGAGLCYVTATEQILNNVRSDDHASEFNELFVGRTHWLGMLEPDDAALMIQDFAAVEDKTLEEDEIAFVFKQAGGHPGLLQASTQILLRVASGAPQDLRQQGFILARDALDSSPIVHSECAKLWEQLEKEEREALMLLVTLGTERVDDACMQSLRRKGILKQQGTGAIFGQLFERFTRRQRLIRQGSVQGVFIDVDAGEARVDGVKLPTLTDLEYRLLLLLYGRLNKICDKSQIINAVWGEDYIVTVDDARIEKLVSRLRSKLERDPSDPHYLITMRGRGYKLVGRNL